MVITFDGIQAEMEELVHDIKLIMKDKEAFKNNLGKRGLDLSPVDEVVELHQTWKKLTTDIETKKAEINKLSQQVGQFKREKKEEEAQALMTKVSELKEEMKQAEGELESIDHKERDILMRIPNLLSDATPFGKSENDNQVVKVVGTPPQFSFKPLDHVDIGEKLGMLDFDASSKITAGRFALYKGDLARLERALINFMLDEHTANGYTEILPPVIVHERSLMGAGQLPKFKEDLFKLEGRDWYLSPTAEVPLVNIKREELFALEELPLRYCAYTACFRSEAGSYGKDTRGLIRLHQFNKVELVNIVASEKSEEAFDEMVNRASSILEKLKLPFRWNALCSGDIGFGSMRTIDLEVWLPAQNCYREISSVSNCGEFQGRRAQIRYRNSQGKPEFAHTLNGSGLAVGRTLVAILENYQQEDGSVVIPEVLRGYMNGKTHLTRMTNASSASMASPASKK